MDKDIAVLIIHALIKQLGMHRAGSRLRKRRVKEKAIEKGEAMKEGQKRE